MVKRNLEEILSLRFDTTIKEATNEQVYVALLEMTKNCIKNKGANKGERKLYYISAEFLIGKLLSNNLINLGLSCWKYSSTFEYMSLKDNWFKFAFKGVPPNHSFYLVCPK